MTPKNYVQMAIAVVLLSIGGCYYLKGRTDATTTADNTALRATAEATSASVQISNTTAAAVDTEGYETRSRTAKAVEAIHARSSDSDSSADTDVLRLAQEAHDRAIRAACRVQRTSDCPAPAAAAER